MKRNQSVEDYLEQILIISKKKTVVRSIDIATSLSFSKPSISIAMKKLVANNLIIISEKGCITLTAEGLIIAKETLERHEIITSFLIKIGVDNKTALTDACKIEHNLSKETFDAIKKHVKSIDS